MNVQAITDLTIRGSPPSGTGTVQAAGEAARNALEIAREGVARAVERGREERQPDAEQVRQTVDALNGFLKANESHIQFALHEKMKQLMVQVIDDRTQEVIKTFPPKELLDLAAKIRELVGALLDKKG